MGKPSANSESEHLLRELAPRVLGALLRRGHDFTTAEDAVQEALLAAHFQWTRDGMPENPGGWLFRVATRRLADSAEGDAARRRREERVAQSNRELQVPDSVPPDDFAAAAGDDTLILLFTCCHPALSTASSIALTLRAVGGLTTSEIARAFMVPEATMAQRIARAKQSIELSGVPFALPTVHERAERLTAVLHVLYLVFNEGYASSSASDLVRIELSREAIRLTRALHRQLPQDGELAGLLALMLLTDARREARIGKLGELIPLDEQDRSRWDRRAIREGSALVAAAFQRGSIGSYCLQAAIAALHSEAPTVEATDWPQIQALYAVLLRMADNPMVALNHAIATAMVEGPTAGLARLDALAADERLSHTHRLDAARGHLFERAGDLDSARTHYRRAADRAPNPAERHYLLKKLARLEGR